MSFLSKFRKINAGVIHTAWVIANVLVIICTLVAAYGGRINPDIIAWPQLANMTFVVWIFITPVLALINWWKSRWLTWAYIIVMVICIVPFSAFWPVHLPAASMTPSQEKGSLSIMTYNVFGYNDRMGSMPEWGSRTLSEIIKEDADIVCLQESGILLNSNGRFKAQTDTLRKRYKYVDETYNQAGNVVWSKYPIHRVETGKQDWGSGRYDAYMVEIDTTSILLINCHLQSIGLTPADKSLYRQLTDRQLNRPTRRELSQVKHNLAGKLMAAFRVRAQQARQIRDLIDSYGKDQSVILVGDFNDIPGSYAYHTLLSTGLRDAYADTGFGPLVTYNDNRFYFHIDQVLYRGYFYPLSVKRGNIKSSDHYWLLATFLSDGSEGDQIYEGDGPGMIEE